MGCARRERQCTTQEEVLPANGMKRPSKRHSRIMKRRILYHLEASVYKIKRHTRTKKCHIAKSAKSSEETVNDKPPVPRNNVLKWLQYPFGLMISSLVIGVTSIIWVLCQ
jgi:hypothetical protein